MKKTFIVAPANFTTGGVELLHQLADVINNSGVEGNVAYIAYVDENQTVCQASVPAEYQKYNIQTVDSIEDLSSNVVVLPEVMVSLCARFAQARVVIWWLSVDNFFIVNQERLSMLDLLRFDRHMFWSIFRKRTKVKAKKRLMTTITLSMRQLRKSKQIVEHLYQSEYARVFLANNGIRNVHELSDYINCDFFEPGMSVKKESAIAYNPKKGFDFTQQLIEMAPDLDWRPIERLSRSGVIDLLKQCKVYIDFGNHPGKDRIPREAALCGCVVITGRRGAAAFDKDVPIPAKYKIDELRGTRAVIKQIRKSLGEYEKDVLDFKGYREMILREKADFVRQALSIFA